MCQYNVKIAIGQSFADIEYFRDLHSEKVHWVNSINVIRFPAQLPHYFASNFLDYL